MLQTVEDSQVPIEYVWASAENSGDHMGPGYRRILYKAYLCRIPGIKTAELQFKLFVQEAENQKRVVFE